MNQKVHLFNQTIKNILCNFIPHETVTCDDRDPPWINSKIKDLLQEKNIAKKCYFQNNKDIQLFRRFQCMQNLPAATIKKSKEQFYSRISTMLMDPIISPKTYWSILKTFLNNKKIPFIPPIYHNNNYITDFKGKAQIFNDFLLSSDFIVCGNILERLIYNKMFEFFTENELISQNQSGFKPGVSCISQLLCIINDIYQSLDDGLETRAIFLDISKAFDKVWHEGLLFKLKQNSISGKLLNVITDFLYQRKQRAVLSGQHLSWTNVQAGVPQGSVLGPLFFLIYVNDLSDGLNSNPKLFADDTSLFSVVQNINSTANDLNSDLIKISDWAFK